MSNLVRIIDQIADGWAHESKYGFVSMSPRILRQIRNDAALIRNGSIEGATWHFFKSARTGKIGASQSVLGELRRNGIKVVFHG